MYKKIIIDGADFSKNGVKEQGYVDFTEENGGASETQQGFVLFDNGSYKNRNALCATSSAYYNRFVKSTKAIYLHPGDTLVVMEMPYIIKYLCIYGYRQSVVNTSNWPEYTPTTSNKYITKSYGSSSHYAVYGKAEGSSVPMSVKNTHATEDLCIVIQGRTTSGQSTSPTQVPYIEYRIYTDDPEAYEEEETEE